MSEFRAGTGSCERFHTAMPPGWQVILHRISALKLSEQRMASGTRVWQGSFLCQIRNDRDVAARDLLVVRHLGESEWRMQRMLLHRRCVFAHGLDAFPGAAGVPASQWA